MDFKNNTTNISKEKYIYSWKIRQIFGVNHYSKGRSDLKLVLVEIRKGILNKREIISKINSKLKETQGIVYDRNEKKQKE